MRLIVIGCEYAGKTSIVAELGKWWTELTGAAPGIHDHFVVPDLVHKDPPKTDAEEAQIATLIPSLLEKFQRYNIEYHLWPFRHDNDMWAVNHYYGDAVYAPLYYGYGGAGEYSDRRMMARYYDRETLDCDPDAVIVLVKATPEVIRRRMAAEPRPKCPLKEADVEKVLGLFQEEFERSLIFKRIMLDTSTATVAETVAEAVKQVTPFIPEKDTLRILRKKAVAG